MKKRVPLLLILLLSVYTFYISSQQQGFNIVIKTSDGSAHELYKKYRALVIGVDDYFHWPQLPNTVKNAREVYSVLRERGFITKILENPTSKEIKEELKKIIFQESNSEDGVLIYFAGHGETMKLADGTELGYIIPRDCPLQSKDPISFREKAISMEDIQTFSLQLKAKHLLAVFDCCFSDSIFALGKAAPLSITNNTLRPVRQYITAGGADESIPDESIFTNCFLDALNGDADMNRDGYVTGSELGMYLESNVVNYSDGAQHPQYRTIRNRELNKGDFVFVFDKTRQNVHEEIHAPPKTEMLDLSSIEKSAKQREELLRKWKDWQEQMKSDFKKVENIDDNPINTSEEKKTAWNKFLRNYYANNPFSSEDEELRQEAEQRLKALAKVNIVVGGRVNLRSTPESLSENDISKMLKRFGFFSMCQDWNKDFCNTDGDFTNNYRLWIKDGDQVVIDRTTGLMWHQSGSEERLTYKKAKRWVKRLNSNRYAGYMDWRLPTIEEAASLIETKKMNGYLYINPVFSAKQEWIWTKDSCSGKKRVWIVHFISGFVSWSSLVIGNYVRPVRL